MNRKTILYMQCKFEVPRVWTGTLWTDKEKEDKLDIGNNVRGPKARGKN